jgi:hypothetical protein
VRLRWSGALGRGLGPALRDLVRSVGGTFAVTPGLSAGQGRPSVFAEVGWLAVTLGVSWILGTLPSEGRRSLRRLR